jgi:type IX secretion system PorP/SprF family membrane protein
MVVLCIDIFTYFTVLILSMRKFGIFLAGLILWTASAGSFVMAQQDPQFTQNMYNLLAFNPAVAGSQGMLSATAINRQQWMGFDGNPKTTLFSVHSPVKPFGISSGAGLTFMDDRLGFEKNMGIELHYAYRMDLAGGSLGIGVNAGLLSKALNGKWVIPDSDNHIPASQDPAIPDEQVSTMAFDLGLGLFYNTDRLYAGVSVAHLHQPLIDYGSGAMTRMVRHYYGTVGYLIKLPNPVWEIQPSLYFKTDGASSQIDVNTMVIYNKKFWGGVSYRLGDAVAFMAGTELTNGMRVGISYDFTTSAIGAYSNGTVEFMIGYNLEVGTEKFNQRYKSVRFL